MKKHSIRLLSVLLSVVALLAVLPTAALSNEPPAEPPVAGEEPAIATDGASLAAPVIKKLENTVNGVKITWKAVPGAAQYRVFYRNGGKWSKAGDTTGTALTYKKVLSGETYTFTVRCMNADATAYVSSYDVAGKTITYIAAPAMTGIGNTTNGIQVVWKAVPGAVRYRVFRLKPDGGWKTLGDTNGTRFVDKTAKIGTTYTYTVRCISADGISFTSGYDATGRSILRAIPE